MKGGKYVNEKVEMTKKQFIGWIFGSLMLATVIRLFVKVGLESMTTVDFSRKLDVLINICRYGALFTSAVSFGACVSSL